jgi:hypothetical protein
MVSPPQLIRQTIASSIHERKAFHRGCGLRVLCGESLFLPFDLGVLQVEPGGVLVGLGERVHGDTMEPRVSVPTTNPTQPAATAGRPRQELLESSGFRGSVSCQNHRPHAWLARAWPPGRQTLRRLEEDYHRSSETHEARCARDEDAPQTGGEENTVATSREEGGMMNASPSLGSGDPSPGLAYGEVS